MKVGGGSGTSTPSWPAGTFGAATDGDMVLDGTNTYASSLSKSGSVYTMIRNIWADNLTVRAGVTLVKRYELHVRGTLTIEASGIVHDDGNAASGGTQGAQVGATSRLPESTGAAGAAGRNTTGAGANGSSTTDAYGGAGGAGGISGGGASGGTGGTVTAPAAASDQIRDGGSLLSSFGLLQSGTSTVRASGGAGGGAGGCTVGTGTATSGGGGGGAPVSVLLARTIANSGTIRCAGGAGGNAVQSGNGQAGGGGGGGGGYLIIVSNTAQASAGTISVAGGAGGTGINGGASGSNGSTGTIDYRAP